MLKRIINKLFGIKLIKSEKQKDNIAKFCYDIAKISIAFSVIGPIAKFENFNIYSFSVGFVVSIIFFIFGNLLDIKKI